MNTFVNQFLAALDIFRKHNPTIASHQIAGFVCIASQPGITVKDLSEKLGLTEKAAGRVVDVLAPASKYNYLRGFGWISNPAGDPRKADEGLMLSEKGDRIWQELNRLICG